MINSRLFKLLGGKLRSSGLEHGAEMEVLCSCDEPYLPHTATMLRSLLQHNKVSRINLFHNPIPSGELAKLRSLIARYKSELACHEMVPQDLRDFRLHKPYWSVANYFRLLAARILPTNIEKILYLKFRHHREKVTDGSVEYRPSRPGVCGGRGRILGSKVGLRRASPGREIL